MQKIIEIQKVLACTEEEKLADVLGMYLEDERPGVQKLIQRYQKKHHAYVQENERLERMLFYERQYPQYAFIAGIDEAGRGPLAGPVAACAVILPKECKIRYADDSKKLSAKTRESLYLEIMDKAAAVSVRFVEAERIDEINILMAVYEAMREAVKGLNICPELLLNDAVTIPGIAIPQVPIIKGDAKSLSIACASIAAKTARDQLMIEYDKQYPQYGFAENKGYGTESHINALKQYGAAKIHRKTFIRNFL